VPIKEEEEATKYFAAESVLGRCQRRRKRGRGGGRFDPLFLDGRCFRNGFDVGRRGEEREKSFLVSKGLSGILFAKVRELNSDLRLSHVSIDFYR
jgi:hypothetical protein